MSRDRRQPKASQPSLTNLGLGAAARYEASQQLPFLRCRPIAAVPHTAQSRGGGVRVGGFRGGPRDQHSRERSCIDDSPSIVQRANVAASGGHFSEPHSRQFAL
jgi:hypothetical protein